MHVDAVHGIRVSDQLDASAVLCWGEGGQSGRFIHIGRWLPIASAGAVILLGTSK